MPVSLHTQIVNQTTSIVS